MRGRSGGWISGRGWVGATLVLGCLVTVAWSAPADVLLAQADPVGGAEEEGGGPPAAGEARSGTAEPPSANNESVLLNFEDGDIRAVIDSLATALGLSYMIDPRVTGQVTIRTLGRIPKEDLFPVFNRILRNNGIAAVKVGDVYHIVPVGEAKTRAIVPPTAATRAELSEADSFVIEILPVLHVSAEEMVGALEPFITPGGDVFAYARGNLLIVTDLSSNVARVRDIVRVLDTDTFRGMRTRTFKIQNGDLDVIYQEIGTLLGSYGYAVDGSTGLSLIPMPRLESLTAISFDETVLDQIGSWVRMLDIPPEEGAGRKIRVYHVENAKAADLAQILNDLFGGEGGGFGAVGGGGIRGGPIGQTRSTFGRPTGRGITTPARTLGAPTSRIDNQRSAQQLSSADEGGPVTAAQQAGLGLGRTATATATRGLGVGQRQLGREALRQQARGVGGVTEAVGGSVGVVLPGGRQTGGAFGGIPGPAPLLKEEVRIVADEVTNALVILATKADYEMIHDVLKEIDVVPRQVVIEVMIAEVTLTKGLEFGVDHAIRYGGSIEGSATAVRNLGAGGRIDGDDDADGDGNGNGGIVDIGDSIFTLARPATGGFAAFITDKDNFAVLLRALADRSAVKILSAPHIIAADNREAHIQVGQSIPILTGTSTSVLTAANTVVNQVQYRDTGTILTILPQVNSAGLVNMQVTQEVSAVGQENFGATNSPSFLQRTAETTMVVQDGDSILIGGIIDEQRQVSRQGVPFIMDIPVLGRLFRRDTSRHLRTELLILITPHVIRNRDEGLNVTKRFRDGVYGLQGLLDWAQGRRPKLKPEPLPGAGLEELPVE